MCAPLSIMKTFLFQDKDQSAAYGSPQSPPEALKPSGNSSAFPGGCEAVSRAAEQLDTSLAHGVPAGPPTSSGCSETPSALQL